MGINCGNCGGSGFLAEYSHRWGGRCFTCNGTGREITKRKTAREVSKQPLQRAHIRAFEEALHIAHIVDFLATKAGRSYGADQPYRYVGQSFA